MEPIRTPSTNFVYTGPTPDIGDLPCQRVAPGDIRSVWAFTDDERGQIASGANIELGIYGMEPIPPVSLQVVEAHPVVAREEPVLMQDMTEPELAAMCQAMSRSIDQIAAGWGVHRPLFALLLFNDPRVAHYVCNCERSDVIQAMRECADRLERQEDVRR